MTEAEYIAFGHAARKYIWIWRIVNEMGLKAESIILYGNNNMNINLTKNAKN